MPGDRTTRRQVVPTAWFADAIEPLIDEEIRQAIYDDERKSAEDSGAIMQIAQRAAQILGADSDSFYRRVFSIREKDYLTLNVDIADALLMALDSSLIDTGVPVLAGTPEGAIEMVEAHTELDTTEPTTVFEQRLLARTLLRFSRGVVRGYHYGLDEQAPLAEAA